MDQQEVENCNETKEKSTRTHKRWISPLCSSALENSRTRNLTNMDLGINIAWHIDPTKEGKT